MGKRKQPETSLAAHKSLDPSKTQELLNKILWGLKQIGGGTFEDVSKAIREPEERVWKRLSDLQKAGKIYRPGAKKILSSGREGFVWKVTESGEVPQQTTERFPAGKTAADFAKQIIQKTLF